MNQYYHRRIPFDGAQGIASIHPEALIYLAAASSGHSGRHANFVMSRARTKYFVSIERDEPSINCHPEFGGFADEYRGDALSPVEVDTLSEFISSSEAYRELAGIVLLLNLE